MIEDAGVATPMEIKLTIDHMKHSMVQMLGDYEGKISKAVTEMTRDYLEKFDFEAAVQQQVGGLVKYALQNQLDKEVTRVVGEYLRYKLPKRLDVVVKKEALRLMHLYETHKEADDD